MKGLVAFATRGGVAVAVTLAVLVLASAEVAAEDTTVRVETMFDSFGVGGAVITALAAASVICAVVAVRAVRRPNAWPHWARLVAGLGEAAFLVGILTGLTRLYWGLRHIADLRLATTFADAAGPVSEGLAAIILGATASLIALGLGGLVRLREPRSQPS
jgi:hypothetical protein